MKRTEFVGSVALLSLAGTMPARADAVNMVAFHCGGNADCCSHWVDEARLHGYSVSLYYVSNELRIAKCRIPKQLVSCHTAVVGDYFFEGHVPFQLIDRVLAERPATRGIAIPGMPLGLPGLEGRWPEAINVYYLDNPSKVYASLPATA